MPADGLTRDLINELEQYRRILNNIPAEIGVLDRDGRYLFNTPSGIRDPEVREWMLGKTNHEWVRKRGHPIEIADKRQAAVDHCFSENESVTFEEIWTDRHGRRLHYVRTFSPVEDEAGVVTHVLGYGQEITQLKKAEEELRTALAEVEALKDRLHDENQYLREEVQAEYNFEDMVGESLAMANVRAAIETVAPTDANVVISGETGTGKEAVARAIYALSARRDKPLIKVNCASIPRELFESEFFGHVKGAFTGAIRDRAGRFQLADQGTLFLDEIGEIPLEMQGKLLRVLQEGEFERVGEAKTRSADVRIIAATNRNLKAEVEGGRFRQDLYYRLNVFPIDVPPLRHRGEDIQLLATHYLERSVRKLSRGPRSLTSAEASKLRAYEWPGNVRELQNVIERAVITNRSGPLSFDLPLLDRSGPPETRSAAGTEVDVLSDAEMRRREHDNVLRALERTNWRVYGPDGAAALLGVKATTLASRIRKLGLTRRRPRPGH